MKTRKNSARDRELKAALTEVRDALLGAQLELKRTKACSVVLIITGVPSAGRSEVVNDLLSWLDPKHVSVYSPDREACEDFERPLMWRYWRNLPARGRIGVFFEGWYDGLLRKGVKDESKRFDARTLERINQLERMLLQDGVRVLKVHLHVSRVLQEQRIRELRASKLTRWRITARDVWFTRHHEEVDRVAKRLRAGTHEACSWHLLDGSHPEQRVLEVARLLLQEIRAGLAGQMAEPAAAPKPIETRPIDAAPQPVSDDQYELELEELQGKFALLTRKKRFEKRALVLAFEGMDAAGKGGAIRRVTHALDARQYRVIPVSAPSADELLYPYLWRFWREAPQRGEVVIFDRSWYGRVLVERVRGFAEPADWQRAYEEIVELERQWCEHGAIVQKFWLSVSLDEQQERFAARESDPLKRFKVDPEDWENRKHYGEYQQAAAEMMARTDVSVAPWTIINADDKKSARLQVLRQILGRLADEL